MLALEGYFSEDCPAFAQWRELKAKSSLKDTRSEFAIFDLRLRYSDIHPVTLATELLYFGAGLHPQNVQQAIIASTARNPGRLPIYWLNLSRVLRTSEDKGVIVQIAEVFKHILSPNNASTPVERGDFAAIFFDKGILNDLVDWLINDNPLNELENQDSTLCSLRLFAKSQAIGICRECAHQHQARSRFRVSCEGIHGENLIDP